MDVFFLPLAHARAAVADREPRPATKIE